MTTSGTLAGLRPRTSTGTRSVDSAAAGSVHTVVEATARQARADSTADLQHHQQQAQRAAQHRARQLVSTARPGPRSTHARYDAAARLPQATSKARWADIPGDIQTRLIAQWGVSEHSCGGLFVGSE